MPDTPSDIVKSLMRVVVIFHFLLSSLGCARHYILRNHVAQYQNWNDCVYRRIFRLNEVTKFFPFVKMVENVAV